MKLKKLICVSLICMLSASMIAGCNGNEMANDGKVQLEVGNWPDGDVEKENAEKYEAYKTDFENTYPDIKIKDGNSYGYDTTTFNVKASAGKLPNFLDTWFTEINKIVDAGYACDISQALEKEGLIDIMNHDMLELLTDENGRIYGIPKEAYAQGLFINKKLFAEAGLVNEDGTPKIPRTYMELAEYAKIIKDKTGVSGFALPTTANAGGWHFMNIAWSFGVEFMEEQADGKYIATFDSPQFRNALQYIYDLRWKYNVLPDNKVLDIAEHRKTFGTGQTAMMFGDPSIVNDFVAKYGMNKDEIFLAKMPAGDEGRYSQMGGGVTIFTSKTTPEQAEAGIKWLKFVGRTPDITPDVENRIRDEYQKTIDDGGVVFPKEFFSIWQSSEREQKIEEIAADYANVNMADYEDYYNFQGVTIRPEEPVACQELYAVLDGVIQEILTNQNADINALASSANNDFQKNHLDKLD